MRVAGLCVVAALLAACSGRIEARGNLPDPERLAEVQPGQISRDEVAEILGSPSTVSVFDDETWYYISKRTETVAFFRPEVAERQVLILHFDKDGMLTSLETLGVEDGRDIDLVDRETPTMGKQLNVLQQIFGNLGRFNK